jgi:hypothetical protein
MNELGLPKEYIPYEHVWVCGNIFDNGKILIEIEGNPVFLIGKGDSSPLLWLNRRRARGIEGKILWVPVIRNNEILEANFEIYETKYGWAIMHKEESLIHYNLTDEVLVISHIDLTPVGLNIRGNLKSLRVSGMNLSNNSFNNVGTMIGIGK